MKTNPCSIITLNKYSHTIESPTIILKKRNFDVLGEILNYSNWRISLQANGIDDISFDLYKYNNGQKCVIWDKLIDLSIIEVQGYGHFEVKINITDSNETIKSVSAQSLEVELGQLTLNDFHVNDEDATTMEQTDYNKDDYDEYGEFIPTVFCNFYDTKHSLLHRVLSDKAPHWTIGHVPDYIAINKTDKPELATQFQRTFTVDGTTIYDFLTGDVAKESNVVFLFDTYNRIINCYNLEDYTWEDFETQEKIIIDAIGDDTTIFIDKDNLAQEITVSGNSESIKNCFRINGGDDVITDRIRAVNMNGTNYIYRFANFQLEDMPSILSEKLIQYQEDMSKNETAYYGENGIYTRLCSAYSTYYLLESKMMPQVEITETTAKEQYFKMLDELAQLKAGVFLLSSYSDSLYQGITNNVESLAQIFVDARYTLKIIDSSTKYDSQNKKWSGRFQIYRTIDETDVYYTPEKSCVDVFIDEDEVEYARQKVLKALNKTSMLDIDFDVMDMTDTKIKEYFQLYARARLQSFYDGYETCISILAKLTQTTLSPDKSMVADELYCKYNNLKNIVYEVLQERIAQVKEQENIISDIEKEQSEFQARWNFRNYLGENLFNIFCMYRRDDDYQNDNYISDGLEENDAALTKKAKELLDFSKKEIEKSCTFQRTINTNLNNLLGLEDYELIHDRFALFNFIRIGIDDEIFKLRLIGLDFDSNTPETINVTYSENIENISDGSSDINSILNQVSSISSSFSSTVLQAKSGNDARNEIVNIRNNGLNAALTRIKSSDDNEVVIGAQGVLCKEITDVGYYSDKQTRIIGSGIYITDDNWQTIKACIGETTDGNFGVIADTLCGKVTFSDKIIAGNENGTVTIDGKGITLDGGAITWSNPISPNAVNGLNEFKTNMTNVLGLGNTTITSDSIISPKIGGGYLYIKDSRTINNTGISVEINPNGTIIPSDIGNKDGTYVFNIKKNNNLIMGVDTSGNGYFNGQVKSIGGTIGNWNIGNYNLSSGSGNNMICLDSYNKTMYSISGTKKIVVSSGYLRLYESDSPVCVISSNKWSGTEIKGSSFSCDQESKYLAIGYREDNSAENFAAAILINNGINLHGNTQKVQILSDTLFSNSVQFNSKLTFDNGTYINAIDGGGIYCNEQFSTQGKVCIGHIDYNSMLNVSGNTYISGSLDILNGHPIKYNALHNSNFYTRVALSEAGDNFRPYIYEDSSAECIGIVGLGSPNHKWGNIYSTNGVIATSDRNKKKNIRAVPKLYESLFMNLKPKLYEFTDGTSGRTHVGFISQDVEDSLLDKNLDGTDFAGFCKDKSVKTVIDKDGNETEEPLFDENGKPIFEYSLRYEEFIALNTHMIQQCLNENKELNQRVAYLEENYILKTQGDTI